jgi:mRNA interferase MazF
MRVSYAPGDILRAEVPFTDAIRRRVRPNLVLIDTGDDDIVVARVTGQEPRDRFDVTVTDLASAGLTARSVVRTHKLTTIEKRAVRRKLGELSRPDWLRVLETLQSHWVNS